MSATQADIDALTAEIAQVEADLTATTTALQNELDSLAAANPGLDVSKLQAAIAPLDNQVKALAALQPASAAPPPPPATGSGTV